MIKFIGSVYFALILITTAAVTVIAGTFLESYTSSHLFAARLTYSNPLFALLLWCFFINIFVSTLLRWPFKKAHIPFIITHLGLLMILSGQLVKHYAGTQGIMNISEGCSSCEYYSEHSQALQLTDKNGKTTSYSISEHEVNSPNIKIVSYHPNGSEKYHSWIHDGKAFLTGLPPIPVETWYPGGPPPKGVVARIHHASSTPWHIFPIKTDHEEELINSLADQHPYLILLDRERDGDDAPPEAVWSSLGGKHHREILSSLSSVAMYDGGFEGYTASLEVPFYHLSDTPEAERQALLHAITIQLRQLRDHPKELSPPLKIMYDASELAEVNFVEATVKFMDEWDRSKEFLFLQETESPTLAASLAVINRDSLIDYLRVISPEIQQSADRLSNGALLSICFKAYGLELGKIAPPNRQGLLHDYYAASLFDSQVNQAIPKLSRWHLDEKVSFLQSFPIDAEELVRLHKAYISYLAWISPDLDLPKEYKPSLAEIIEAIRLVTPLQPPAQLPIPEDFPKEKPRLESPLIAVRKGEPESRKVEEHRPIATFELEDAGSKERFTLVYDPYGSALQWPIKRGSLLAKFQPDFKTLPHTLKLRQARQITYAHTGQPYSYEADLWIEPQHELITLSMNQVYETDDGFRFYLAGLSPADPGAWKKVQIVVNKDPGKYWLTYPGALLLLLGSLLLFFRSRRS